MRMTTAGLAGGGLAQKIQPYSGSLTEASDGTAVTALRHGGFRWIPAALGSIGECKPQLYSAICQSAVWRMHTYLGWARGQNCCRTRMKYCQTCANDQSACAMGRARGSKGIGSIVMRDDSGYITRADTGTKPLEAPAISMRTVQGCQRSRCRIKLAREDPIYLQTHVKLILTLIFNRDESGELNDYREASSS